MYQYMPSVSNHPLSKNIWEKIWINKTEESFKGATAQVINMVVNYLLEEAEASVLFMLVKICRRSRTEIKRKKKELKKQAERSPLLTVQLRVAPVDFSATGLFFLLHRAAPQLSDK